MDGYSFMIERHRVLIEHEEKRCRQKARGPSSKVESEIEAELRSSVLALYQGLEGCGRSSGTKRDQER